ncbi:MAG: hypothetical protein DMD60_11520 [Gemmatimonadetes bacterium]|nr:MAG: hypothetical protein DMD60_11520 [Gemmatimonadota bacterium]
MNRSIVALLGGATLAACADLSVPHGAASLAVSPILDSVYVGDRTLAHRVTYIDGNGNPQPPGTVLWTSTDTTIARIDARTGAVTGRKRGAVVITAQAQGITGAALVVVSDTLDITLLLDTVYVLPGDTLRVPVTVLKRNTPPAAAVWFTAPSNSQFSIDSATGRLTAVTAGGPSPYVVHADSLADTGAVYVLSLPDTTGGKMFYSVGGSAISHVGGPAVAVNYRATGGKQAFQLRGKYAPAGTTLQVLDITLADSVITADTTFAIDSLNPAEDLDAAGGPIAVCSPPRSWGFWAAQSPGILGYSRRGGTLHITRIVAVPNGQAVSGYFSFTAQRTDLYNDPLGALVITGSFVAPLVASTTVCR